MASALALIAVLACAAVDLPDEPAPRAAKRRGATSLIETLFPSQASLSLEAQASLARTGPDNTQVNGGVS